VTPELAGSFGMKDEKGALISEVMKNSPAEKAGLQAGDIILEFDGKPIADMHELPRLAAVTPVGKKSRIKVLRNGKTLEKTVTIEKMADVAEGKETTAATKEKFGIAVTDLSKELAARLGTGLTSGVVVTEVKPGSAADEAGIAQGDIIQQINGVPVANSAEYTKLVSPLKKGVVVRFLVRRGDGSLFVALKVD